MEPYYFADPDVPVLKKCKGECYQGTYTLNATYGCSHNCAFCYVASIPSNMRKIGALGGHFDVAHIKKNVADLVDTQIRKIKEKPVLLRLSTMSDIFQPAVLESGVARELFEVFNRHDMRIYLMTKNVPNEEVLKLIQAQPSKYHYVVTCASVDDSHWKLFEPGTARPIDRIKAAVPLLASGVPVDLDLDPLIPGFDDTEEALRKTIAAAREAGIHQLYAAFLFLRPQITKRMRENLPREVFDLVHGYYQGGQKEYLRPDSKSGGIFTLPFDYQMEKLDLLQSIVREAGLELKVCSKKNGPVAQRLGLDMCTRLRIFDNKFNL